MSSVFIGARDVPKRSYIATTAPNGHVYSYTKSYNSATYTWSGALTAIDFTAATYSTYNSAGVVFRETGKRLYADANPGVDRFMVGVYIVDQSAADADELGSMFIDPNCSAFALFNGDRPTYIPTNTDDAASPASLDLGNPVYTLGDITTTQGNIVASAGSITASGQIRSSTITAIPLLAVDASAGQIFTKTLSGAANTITFTNGAAGSTVTLVLTAPAGGTTVTFGAAAGDVLSAGTLVMAANAVHSVTFIYTTVFTEIARSSAALV